MDVLPASKHQEETKEVQPGLRGLAEVGQMGHGGNAFLDPGGMDHCFGMLVDNGHVNFVLASIRSDISDTRSAPINIHNTYVIPEHLNILDMCMYEGSCVSVL